MSNCNHEEKKDFITPEISYDEWKQKKLLKVEQILHDMIDRTQKPLALVLEIGHFSPLFSKEEFLWAKRNIDFADELCGRVIKKYKRFVRITPTILVNNLDEEDQELSNEILNKMFEGKKYINLSSVKTLSERNLKNRAYKALKNDTAFANSFINIDGKAYFKNDEYQNDLAAGFVNESGKIVPRCGLILTSYIDKVISLAKQRLANPKATNIIFLSFSQELHEYKRVRLGVDIYTQTKKDVFLSPIVIHWHYEQSSCLIASRVHDMKSWATS